jgi:hypothetical protein
MRLEMIWYTGCDGRLTARWSDSMELRMKQPPLDAQIVCIYTPVAPRPLALYPELAGIDCRASRGDCGPR